MGKELVVQNTRREGPWFCGEEVVVFADGNVDFLAIRRTGAFRKRAGSCLWGALAPCIVGLMMGSSQVLVPHPPLKDLKILISLHTIGPCSLNNKKNIVDDLKKKNPVHLILMFPRSNFTLYFRRVPSRSPNSRETWRRISRRLLLSLMLSKQIILGSQSIARRNILAKMGYEFTTMTADINEKGIRREKPEELVMVLAEAKADAIVSRLKIEDYKKDVEPTLLVTSDIVVVHNGIIREKPSSKEEARQFLKGYSRGHVSTVGSVLVTNLKTGLRRGGIDKAEVYFHNIPDEIVEKLIDEGVVFNVAGGLLLEHPLTQTFVNKVVGDSDSIMGISKELTQKLIREVLSVQFLVNNK